MKVDYRDILKNEFQTRTSLKPMYSLRAFARDLGLAAPQLSSVLARKRGISVTSARKIAGRLALSESEMQAFCASAAALHGRSRTERENGEAIVEELAIDTGFEILREAQFSIVANWYHIAILQLIETEDFSARPGWIAERLLIETEQAREALKNLEIAKLIRIRSSGKIEKIAEYVKTPEIPSRAIRTFHRQMLKKADAAVEAQSLAERDLSSVVVAVDPAQVPEMKKWIAEFRERFCQRIGAAPAKSEVYSLSMQLFRLSESPTESK